MSIVVVQHEPHAPLGLLTRDDVPTRTVHAYRGDAVPSRIGEASGLIVLGGGMNAYADERHPWLAPTKQLIVDAVAARTPTLLLCLGHQLGAVALGGRVDVGSSLGPLWGTAEVGLTDEGRADPLLGRLPAGARVVHWNSDVVAQVPPGGVVLARDPRGAVQAVRYGENAWGIQAHPEADSPIVQAWADEQVDDLERARAAMADIRDHEAAIDLAWRPVLDAFLALTEVVRR